MNPPLVIDLRSALRSLGLFLLACEASLFLLDFLFAYLDLLPQKVIQHSANLAREDGIGTWFGATQAFCVGLVLALTALLERSSGRSPLGYALLSALFTYIAMDDSLGLHERIGSAVKSSTGSPLFNAFPTYAWQLVFGPLFGSAALFMLVFLYKRLSPTLVRLLFAALACFVVAVGLDFVEGVDGAFVSISGILGVDDYTVSHAFKVTEELLEMFGTSLFLLLFLAQLGELLSRYTVQIKSV